VKSSQVEVDGRYGVQFRDQQERPFEGSLGRNRAEFKGITEGQLKVKREKVRTKEFLAKTLWREGAAQPFRAE